jgi:UDP-glucuronate 4-epimerase
LYTNRKRRVHAFPPEAKGHMRVAVTGAAGFIGSHLCEQLVAIGHHVVGLDNLDHFYDPATKRANLKMLKGDERFSWVEIDVRDRDALGSHLRGADAVVHLAARAGVRPSFDSPNAYVEANVHGTGVLLDVVSALGVPRLVFCSSSTVYGDGARTPFREHAELGTPKSPYAATKVAAEALCRAFAHQVPNIIILRLFSVYGPRQRPDLAFYKFAKCIAQGRPLPILGSTASYRDYTYVDDVVAGIVASLDIEEALAVFNLASGKPVTLEQMIVQLETALGRKANRRQLPPHPGDLFGTWGEITAARERLGYCPSWNLEAGVARFAEWFLAGPANPASAVA